MTNILLRSRTIKGIPSEVSCYSLNYVTHKLLVCTKDDVYLYDIDNQSLINNMNYAKRFAELYDSEASIKSVDSIILSNLWVAFVNKKSFVFFNENLDFSPIYSAEPNPAISLQVFQRANEIITLRGDRKVLRFWKFEVMENFGEVLNEEGRLFKNDSKKGKDNVKKTYRLSETKYSFEVDLNNRKSLSTPQNRIIMNYVFSEELGLMIVSLDNMELMFYNLATCESLQKLSFSSPSNKETLNIPCLALEQEILFYCDNKRFVMYDLVLNEEKLNYHHGLPFRVISLHADRSNAKSGVYLVSHDDRFHIFSSYKRKIIWSESLLPNTGIQSLVFYDTNESQLFSKKMGSTVVIENSTWQGSFAEVSKREYRIREKMEKIHCHFTTHVNSRGLMTLYTDICGKFNIYDMMNFGEVCFKGKEEIVKAEKTLDHVKNFGTLTDFDSISQESQVLARITLQNNKITSYNLSDFKEVPKSTYDLNSFWMNSIGESNGNTGDDKLEVIGLYPLFEERLMIVLTQGYIHIVSLGLKKRVTLKSNHNDISAYTAICLNQNIKDKYYVILGTSKGMMLILECDFFLKSLRILKSKIRHEKIILLKYIPEVNCLMSIGSEGNIFLKDVSEVEQQNSVDFFKVIQSHKLVWHSVTSLALLTGSKIIAGMKNGVVQYVKFNWKKNLKVNSELLQFHEAPICHVSGVLEPNEEILSCCEDGIISYWQIGIEKPVKVFRLADPIHSIFLHRGESASSKPEMFIALKNSILKLDYDYGNNVTLASFSQKDSWTEALSLRQKHFAKNIRDCKTMSPKIQNILNRMKIEKKGTLENAPILFQCLFGSEEMCGLKSLQIDFARYIMNERARKSKQSVWILDFILDDFNSRKIENEPLIKADNKSEKKTDDGSMIKQLGKTLRKYPVIKSIMMEKYKENEQLEMHKNVALLLNYSYKGEDILEEQYKFLETKFDIKRKDLDEAHLLRAKALYYKKKNVVKKQIPKLSLDKPKEKSPPRVGFLLKDSYGLQGSQSTTARMKTVSTTTRSYRDFSLGIDKEISKPLFFPHESVRLIVEKNSYVKLSSSSLYRPSKTLKKNQKFDRQSSYGFLPSRPNGLSSSNLSSVSQNEGLALDQSNNTIALPPLTTARSDYFKTTFLTEPKEKKEIVKLDTRMSSTFPKRRQVDFVSQHAQGYTNTDNIDLYKHLLRHMLQNQHLLIRKKPSPSPNKQSKNKDEIQDEKIEYIPLAIKQLILQSNQEQLTLLSQIPVFYEHVMGESMENKSGGEEYNVLNIQSDFEKENNFLEEVLNIINEKGIDNVNLETMVKFKQIVGRRIEIFSQLEDYIQKAEISSDGSESSKEVEAVLKSQFSETFERIKDIQSTLGINNIPKTILHSRTFSVQKARNSENLDQASIGIAHIKSKNSESYTTKIVDTILQTVGAIKYIKENNPREQDFVIEKKASTANEILETQDYSLPIQAEIDFPEKKTENFPRGSTDAIKIQLESSLTDANSSLASPKISSLTKDSPYSLKYPITSKDFAESRFVPPPILINNPSQRRISNLRQVQIIENLEDLTKDATDHDSTPGTGKQSPGGNKEGREYSLMVHRLMKKKNPNINTSSGNVVTPKVSGNKAEATPATFRNYRRYETTVDRRFERDPTSDQEHSGEQQPHQEERKNSSPRDKNYLRDSLRRATERITQINAFRTRTESTLEMNSQDTFKVKKVRPEEFVLSEHARQILKNLGTMIIPDFLNRRPREVTSLSPDQKRQSVKIDRLEKFGKTKLGSEPNSASALKAPEEKNDHRQKSKNGTRSSLSKTLKRSGSTEEKNKSKEKFIMLPVAASYHGTPKEVSVCEDEEDMPTIKGSEEEVAPMSTLRVLETATVTAIETSVDEKKLRSVASPLVSLRIEEKLDNKRDSKIHLVPSGDYNRDKNEKQKVKISRNLKKEKGGENISNDSFSSEGGQRTGFKTTKHSSQKTTTKKPEFSKSKTHAVSKQKTLQPDQEGDQSGESPLGKMNRNGTAADLKISINHIKTGPASLAKSKLLVDTKAGKLNHALSEKIDSQRPMISTLVESQIISEEGTQILKSRADLKLSKSLKNESLIIHNNNKRGGGKGTAKKKGSKRNINSDLSGNDSNVSSEQVEEESPYSMVTSESRDSPLSARHKLIKKTRAIMKVSRITKKNPINSNSSISPTIDNLTEEGLSNYDHERFPRKSYLSGKLDNIEEHSLEGGGVFDLRQKLVENGKLSQNEDPAKDEVEQLLANPLELLQEVINEASIDQETKLDLYIYGSRKQALQDYIKDMESNLEINILSQKSCQDQLTSFFDLSLSKLMRPKDFTFYNQLMAPYSRNKWKKNTEYGFSNDDEPYYDSNGRLIIGPNDEWLRKQEFLRQREIVNQLKLLDRRALPEVSQQSVQTLDINKRKILLGEKIIETLILRGNTLLSVAGSSQEIPSGKLSEREKGHPLPKKLEILKQILKRLKNEKPLEFVELIKYFDETKIRYEEALQESDPLKFLF